MLRQFAIASIALVVCSSICGAEDSYTYSFEPHRIEYQRLEEGSAGVDAARRQPATYHFSFPYTFTYTYTVIATDSGQKIRLRPSTFQIKGRQTTTLVRLPGLTAAGTERLVGYSQLYAFAYQKAESQAPGMCRRILDQEFIAPTIDEAKALVDAYYTRWYCETYSKFVGRMVKEYDELLDNPKGPVVTPQAAVQQVIGKRQ